MLASCVVQHYEAKDTIDYNFFVTIPTKVIGKPN
jgi:hypothetical protein